MPNWCSNIIRIRNSTPETIDTILSAILDEQRRFDFNRLIPRPEILNHTASGWTMIDGVKHRSWFVDQGPDGERNRAFTDEEKAELSRIGHYDWYSWSIQNWGTKWNACDTAVDDSLKEYGDADISYQTAWSPPVPILNALKAKFPDVDIETRFRNEDDDEYPHEA